MPWIELEGAVNVRDLGGLPAGNGGRTASDRLLRGDNLQELTPSDIARLVRDIGVTTIVDLRSTAGSPPRARRRWTASGACGTRTTPCSPSRARPPTRSADVLLTRADQDRSRYPGDPVAGHYLGYLEDRPDQVIGALRSIASSPGAALVHCAAGKDRTGVVVAVALTAVGVPAEVVVADYAATGERTEQILDGLRRARPTPPTSTARTTDRARAAPGDHGGVPGADGRAVCGVRPGWTSTASALRT